MSLEIVMKLLFILSFSFFLFGYLGLIRIYWAKKAGTD